MSGPAPFRLDDVEIRAGVSAILAAEGPRWLSEQRWFADKGRSIQQVALEDLLTQADGSDLLLLAILKVEFAAGTPARYLLPLAIATNTSLDSIVAPATFLSDSHLLIDGLAAPRFGNWLLDLWAGQSAADSTAWQFVVSPAATALFQQAHQSPGLPMGAEQSNTSIRFDEALIVKLFRRLQPGLNPDEEILHALGSAAFPGVPAFAGSASWRAADGATYPIALAQAFVPNQGDGWAWMLRRLRTLVTSPSLDRFEAERMLGRRTAGLHLALSRIGSPDFKPESADSSSIAAEIQRLRGAVDRVSALLHERESDLPDAVRTRLPLLLVALRQSAASADGFQAESGLPRIRVHGDFHLGQTLRTPDNDWIIIDFEGEPARPVTERRQRASALKDVAGMLRSFNYARGVVEREDVSRGLPEVAKRLQLWEQGARHAFLTGYREIRHRAEPPLVPLGDEAFARALAAWELEKALYEIEYEVRNRPSWLEIPLSALQR